MAKLKAHGHEVLRYSKETAVENDESVDWRRDTFAIMADGVVLRKQDANFKATAFGSYTSPARRHTWGWKRHGKMRQGFDLRETRAKAIAAGFKIEVDQIPEPAGAC